MKPGSEPCTRRYASHDANTYAAKRAQAPALAAPSARRAPRVVGYAGAGGG